MGFGAHRKGKTSLESSLVSTSDRSLLEQLAEKASHLLPELLLAALLHLDMID